MRTPPLSTHRKDMTATSDGVVRGIDNRRLARLAKLAGAPEDKAAGIDLHVRVGDAVTRGAPLFTLHAEVASELAYALAYADANPDILDIGEP